MKCRIAARLSQKQKSIVGVVLRLFPLKPIGEKTIRFRILNGLQEQDGVAI